MNTVILIHCGRKERLKNNRKQCENLLEYMSGNYKNYNNKRFGEYYKNIPDNL